MDSSGGSQLRTLKWIMRILDQTIYRCPVNMPYFLLLFDNGDSSATIAGHSNVGCDLGGEFFGLAIGLCDQEAFGWGATATATVASHGSGPFLQRDIAIGPAPHVVENVLGAVARKPFRNEPLDTVALVGQYAIVSQRGAISR